MTILLALIVAAIAAAYVAVGWRYAEILEEGGMDSLPDRIFGAVFWPYWIVRVSLKDRRG